MSLLSELRILAPDRRLTYYESRVIAERQALALLRLLRIDGPSVPASALIGLPFVRVAGRPLRGTSGATRWMKPRWIVIVNSTESRTRQRFSLGHELKHIIDHRTRAILYGEAQSRQAQERIERLCDYFAACLLMPRPWVKQAYAEGIQAISDLAQLFDVSPEAMAIRLNQLGLAAQDDERRSLYNEYHRSAGQLPAIVAA